MAKNVNIVKIVKIVKKLAKFSKIVKVVKNCPNGQKLSKMVKLIKKWLSHPVTQSPIELSIDSRVNSKKERNFCIFVSFVVFV